MSTATQAIAVLSGVDWLKDRLGSKTPGVAAGYGRNNGNVSADVREPIVLEFHGRRLSLPTGTKCTIFRQYTDRGDVTIATFFFAERQDANGLPLPMQVAIKAGGRLVEKPWRSTGMRQHHASAAPPRSRRY